MALAAPERLQVPSRYGDENARYRVRVRGLVQGVGFRPFVYGLAQRHRLCGWVRNDSDGVLLEVQGSSAAAFLRALEKEAPPLARIDRIEIDRLARQSDRDFAIHKSEALAPAGTAIGADVAICDACLADLFDPSDRHYRYPLVNCTHCGPRYTVTKALPYDRQQTSMAPFALCADCGVDYADPLNRRFHAQPIACPACGPELSAGLEEAWRVLRSGGIVALKGLGGFHLACDAKNAAAVARLRTRKQRDAKPFAVMLANAQSAASLIDVDVAALDLLTSRERPIVLAKVRGRNQIGDEVASGLNRLGVMLPATPLQYLLFNEAAGRPDGTAWLDACQSHAWVMTSANISGEPLIVDDAEAQTRLSGIADLIVGHARAIVVRNDDSVVIADARGGVPVRRARGFAPSRVRLKRHPPPVLALGGHLKATLCITRGDEAFVSQHIGDLDNARTRGFLDEVLAHLLMTLEVEPALLAHDLHPDAFLSPAAKRLGLPRVAVQHHHAHIAAVCAEYGHTGPLIGAALDGFGYGPDGTIWGGELLALDGSTYTRLGRLRPIAQPGGDAAAREPWRMAAAVLHDLGDTDAIASRFANEPMALSLASILEKDVGCPKTSSLGRVFDAAAALLGVCTINRFEGEAAMRLEALVRKPVADRGLYRIEPDGTLDLRAMLQRLSDVDPAAGADLFHGTLIAAVADWLGGAAVERACGTVALSGGCILNTVLREGLVDHLEARGLEVLIPRRVPPGDGGLSLGQAWIAGLQHEGF